LRSAAATHSPNDHDGIFSTPPNSSQSFYFRKAFD
jgi:hypothetical protein